MDDDARSHGRAFKLLIVAERIERTGAALQLLSLLPRVVDELDADVTVLTARNASTQLLDPQVVTRIHHVATPLRIARRTLERWGGDGRITALGLRACHALMRRRLGAFDAVLVNSLTSWWAAQPFVGGDYVLYLHELGVGGARRNVVGEELIRCARSVVVPSMAAAAWPRELGVEEERVVICPAAVPPASDGAAVERRCDPDTFSVLMVGWVSRAKGTDRFIDVAALLHDLPGRPVRFVWVGGRPTDVVVEEMRLEVAQRGLASVVVVEPSTHDLTSYYAQADAFLLTSRSESASLVSLEAAACGVPVVYFPGSGGPDELAAEGVIIRPSTVAGESDEGGEVGEIEPVVECLQQLRTDPALAATLGARGQRAVQQHHQVPTSAALLAATLRPRTHTV